MDSPEHKLQTQERLISDLRQVIENAEELLKNTDSHASQLHQNARAKLELALHAATAELARFEDSQLARMIDATHMASERCRDLSGEARVLRAFDAAR